MSYGKVIKSLLVRSLLKAWLLDMCKLHRPTACKQMSRFTRVSAEFMDMMEADMKNQAIKNIKAHRSAKTLKDYMRR